MIRAIIYKIVITKPRKVAMSMTKILKFIWLQEGIFLNNMHMCRRKINTPTPAQNSEREIFLQKSAFTISKEQ